MANFRIHWKRFVALTAIVVAVAGCAAGAKTGNEQAQSLRLYVFDCGTLHYDNADAYQLKREEVARTDMSLACFLVVHPKGTLIWDAGAIADGSWTPTGLRFACTSFCPTRANGTSRWSRR